MTTKEEKALIRANASLKKKQESVLRERARIKNLEVRVAAKERKLETRRKILQGAYLNSAWTTEEISAAMDGYLTKPRDRSLYGLPPLGIGNKVTVQAVEVDDSLVDTIPR